MPKYDFSCRHGCPPVNLLHIFRTPFSKNNSGGVLLSIAGSGSGKKSFTKLH